MTAPPEPHRPPPAKHPVAILERTGAALRSNDGEIEVKRRQMGELGVAFSAAKAELKELLSRRALLSMAEDVALEALQRKDRALQRQESQASQEPRVTGTAANLAQACSQVMVGYHWHVLPGWLVLSRP